MVWAKTNGYCGNLGPNGCDEASGTLVEYSYVYNGTPGHCVCTSTYETTVDYIEATDSTNSCTPVHTTGG